MSGLLGLCLEVGYLASEFSFWFFETGLFGVALVVLELCRPGWP